MIMSHSSFHLSFITHFPGCVNEEILGPYNLSYCKTEVTFTNLTFRGPCIVIYSYNKTNEKH